MHIQQDKQNSFFATSDDYGFKNCHWTTGLERKNCPKKGNAKWLAAATENEYSFPPDAFITFPILLLKLDTVGKQSYKILTKVISAQERKLHMAGQQSKWDWSFTFKMQQMLCAAEIDPQENLTQGTSWQKLHACQILCKSLPQPADEKCSESSVCSVNCLHAT